MPLSRTFCLPALLLLCATVAVADHHRNEKDAGGDPATTQLPADFDGTAAGPGPANLAHEEDQLFKPLTHIDSRFGMRHGHSVLAMHKGYLVIIASRDGGRGNGSIAFFDISDLSNPKLVHHSYSNETKNLSEAHAVALGRIGGRDIACLRARDGLQFWDWTDVTQPKRLSELKLPPMRGGDYSGTPWWFCLQGHYVFVGGANTGLHVVDASDPDSPKRIAHLPTTQTGGFRIGPTFAVGNLLVISSMDSKGMAALDIGDPAKPALIGVNKQHAVGYSSIFNGGYLYAVNTVPHVFDFRDPMKIRQIAEYDGEKLGGKGGYGMLQDGFLHMGVSSNFAKVDMRDPTKPKLVAKFRGTVGGTDLDGGSVVGNLSIASCDHGKGSWLAPHQTEPDKVGPSVNFVSPADGATHQAVTTRIGVTMTDQVDVASASRETFIVRMVGGEPLRGSYSHQTGIVNFSPAEPLQKGMTYEVVIPKGGLQDAAGNATPEQFVSRFTTGEVISDFPVEADGSKPTATGEPASFKAKVAKTAEKSKDESWSWDFGDGRDATPFEPGKASVRHAFGQPGHYTVLARVKAGQRTGAAAVSHTVHRPLPAQGPTRSSTIVFDAKRGRTWNVNADNDTVTCIDTSTMKKIAEIAVDTHPRTLALGDDGRLWVACEDDAKLNVIDTAALKLTHRVKLPIGSMPFGVALSPGGDALYVTLRATGQVLRLDAKTGKTLGSVDLKCPTRHVAVSPDGRRVFVARFISSDEQGEVLELAVDPFALLRRHALVFDQHEDSEDNGRGVPNYLGALAVSPDGARLWVPSKKDNIARGLARDGNALTFETTVRTIVSQIDLQANREVTAARTDLNDRDMASAVAFTPLGDYVFVATQGTNTVEILDAYSGEVVGGISDVGLAPQGLAVSDDGTRLYVHHFMSRSVAAFDTSALVEGRGPFAEPLGSVNTVAEEQLADDVLRGKRLFYNAADGRMSRDSYLSCASCHLDGEDDGRVWDFTDRGEGLRNTISLKGKAGMAHGRVHWSANFDEIQDFEHDIRGPFGGEGFLSDKHFNSRLRGMDHPLGGRKTGHSKDLDDLAAYVTSLDKVGTSPYRNADGSLSDDALAGRKLFAQLDCASCHGGEHFTDSPFAVLHNVGTLRKTSGRRLDGRLVGLDTPTLRGLWLTAPYLHDGSATTLMGVLTGPRAASHGNVAGLDGRQLRQLAAYLLSIDDHEPAPGGDAKLQPIVDIVSPTEGVTVEPGKPIAMKVSSGNASLLERVELVADDKTIATLRSEPFEFVWQDAPLGRSRVVAVAHHRSGARSFTEPVAIAVQPPLGKGTGLAYVAYDDPEGKGEPADRGVSETVDFEHGEKPHEQMLPELTEAGILHYRRVVWSGYVQPTASGEWHFAIHCDEAVKLTVAGKTLIDTKGPMKRKGKHPRLHTGRIELEQGMLVPIRLEYGRRRKTAKLELQWAYQSSHTKAIPSTALYPPKDSE